MIEREFLFGESELNSNTPQVLLDELVIPSVRDLNEGMPFRISRFPDELVPQNQRNLTDFRTRLGTLLEYELSREIERQIRNSKIDDVYVSNVISNKYPDLVIRDEDGRPGLRFEIKTVHTVAEETAANFDTLIKDIWKDRDFVVSMIWHWEPIDSNPDIQIPKIKDVYCFDAHQLALIRDCYWLNTPYSPEDGYQGHDLRFTVTCGTSGYKIEEHNCGKITRLWPHSVDFEHDGWLPNEISSSGIIEDYAAMKRDILRFGFEDVIAQNISKDYDILRSELPFVALVERGEQSFLVYGDEDRSSRYING